MNNYQDPVISKIDFDNKDILEIGCGYGGFTLEHFLHAKSILGIDTNREAIETLRKKWPTSQKNDPFLFRVGNIVDMPLQDKDFDVVVFSHSF